MARRRVHEEHMNHEAWAIPYGDLVTLLLAFFVVMYAVSSVNAGKYRAAADSLSAAFGGPPRSMETVQLGHAQKRGADFDHPSLATAGSTAPERVSPMQVPRLRAAAIDTPAARIARAHAVHQQLQSVGEQIGDALSGLVQQKLVRLRQGTDYLEVEIQSDLLFPSGSAAPSALAVDTVQKLATVLRSAPNAVRVEGYTDDQPIASPSFPSNWELSAARAASVLHVMMQAGVAPSRLSMTGYGEFQPVAANDTPQGRNANRRVMLVILPAGEGTDSVRHDATLAATQAAATHRSAG